MIATAMMTWILAGPLPDKTPIPADLKQSVKVEKHDDITGMYIADGDDYEGMVTIKKVLDVYLVHWAVNGGSTLGAGIRVGDHLSTGWTNQADGKTFRGTTLYKIEGKTLRGRWTTLPGDGKVHNETLTRIEGRSNGIGPKKRN